MKCFCANLPAMVLFTIPDLNIAFKSRYQGKDEVEMAYAAILALLEFWDINPQLFRSTQKLEIFSDNFLVVNQFNDQMFCQKEWQKFRDKAKSYQDKFRFNLSLIKPKENPARQ